MSTENEGFIFDVAEFLGRGPANNKPLYEAPPIALLLRVPDGLSFLHVCNSARGKELFCKQEWYKGYCWAFQPIAAGVYHVQLPIPKSNDKSFVEQQTLLRKDEFVAPVTLVALALICAKKRGYPNSLNDGLVRCAEEVYSQEHVVLDWQSKHLRLSGCQDSPAPDVWAAAARKCD